MLFAVFGSMACSGASKVLCLGLLLIAGYHCARLPKLKALDTFRQNLPLNHSRSDRMWYGKLIILESSQQGSTDPESLLESDMDYQADMGMNTFSFLSFFKEMCCKLCKIEHKFLAC